MVDAIFKRIFFAFFFTFISSLTSLQHSANKGFRTRLAVSPQLALPERNELLSINALRRPTDRPTEIRANNLKLDLALRRTHYLRFLFAPIFNLDWNSQQNLGGKKYVHVRYFKTCGFSSLPPPSPHSRQVVRDRVQ